jgi:hypothetical protein
MIKLDIVFPSAYLSLQGDQDTNHGSLLKNTAYTGQCMTEANVHDIHFQVAQICTTAACCKVLPTLELRTFEISEARVQRTCRVLLRP